MRRVKPSGRRPMEKSATMPERLALITELLQDTRDAQEKGNSMLADLRVEVASVQRSQAGQAEHISDMRAELRQVSDRLRSAELQLQPMTELQRKQAELEVRVRTLEGEGRETRVVRGAAVAGVRTIWQYIAAALVGAALLLLGWAKGLGGTPG